ncbi:MAG: phosphopantetheine-binding protein [Deltaproteobacteria bacterium]
MNDIFNVIRKSISEILDIEVDKIVPKSNLVQDLGAESIDLLELAVSIASLFKIEVIDNDIFLKSLHTHIENAHEKNLSPAEILKEKYPFLHRTRITEILESFGNTHVLEVKDIVSYVEFYT